MVGHTGSTTRSTPVSSSRSAPAAAAASAALPRAALPRALPPGRALGGFLAVLASFAAAAAAAAFALGSKSAATSGGVGGGSLRGMEASGTPAWGSVSVTVVRTEGWAGTVAGIARGWVAAYGAMRRRALGVGEGRTWGMSQAAREEAEGRCGRYAPLARTIARSARHFAHSTGPCALHGRPHARCAHPHAAAGASNTPVPGVHPPSLSVISTW